MGFWDFLPGAKAAKKAEKTIRGATNEAKGLQQNYLDVLAPYMGAGTGAVDLMKTIAGVSGRGAQADYFDNFEMDPGVQAAVEYGGDQIAQRGHSLGLGKSGGTIDDISLRGRAMYNDDLKTRWAFLNNLAGIGQGATGQYGAGTGALANTIMGGAKEAAGYQQNYGNVGQSFINTGLGVAAGAAGNYLTPGVSALQNSSGGSSYWYPGSSGYNANMY